MAPITATLTGIETQVIDDPELVALLSRLRAFDVSSEEAESLVDIDGLVAELERIPKWRFQELADLYEWVTPLNIMDAALRQIMDQHPSILLMAANDPKKDPEEKRKQAESEEEVNQVPTTVIHAVSTILRFLSTLLRHAYNKSLFNSVNEISDLLASADDGIASQALKVLSNLATLPLLHRMQVHESGVHTTILHSPSSSSTVHSRLMVLARGWGTRGCGLGLFECVTFDDSPGSGGQGSLPAYAGEVNYDYLPPSSSQTVQIQLRTQDIVSMPKESVPERQSEKRRKMSASARTKSTASLFFSCLDQIGGRDKISTEKAFALLSHIRLAKAFHCQETRVRAIERRLWALTALLYAHPTEALAGYFHAQPELCSEIADLLRPSVSSHSISEMGALIHSDSQHKQAATIRSIVEPTSTQSIPFNIRVAALETLNAIVARRDERLMSGISSIAKQTNILSELGVSKGQILGLLPTLIRYALASLNSFMSDYVDIPSEDTSKAESSLDIEKLNLDSGLTFLEATETPRVEKPGEQEKAFEFIELVLFFATSIISITSGTPALTDCGLVPAIVNNIILSTRLAELDKKNTLENSSNGLNPRNMLRLISSLSIQVLEGAIVIHNPALLAFHELKSVDLLIALLHAEFSSNLPHKENDDSDQNDNEPCLRFQASQRIMLYSILNCLTIVLHHQETNSRSSTPNVSAADVLKKPEMTKIMNHLMRNVNRYGGITGALVLTLLTDIMNSDPKIVHYVFESGLADSFFFMMKGPMYDSNSTSFELRSISSETWHEANIPCSSELITTIPNMLSALCLTEDGRKRVIEVNPIPDLLGIMCSSKFAMPNSRCLLNEMASAIGGGIDELIRHVPSIKSKAIYAFVKMIERVEFIGQQVSNTEDQSQSNDSTDSIKGRRNDRVSLMHYGNNVAQLLEQMLRTEEHCAPFIEYGGHHSLLNLYHHLMLRNRELLAHISSQTSPSIANISHSSISISFTTAVKRLAVNDDPSKVIAMIVSSLDKTLDDCVDSIAQLKDTTVSKKALKFANLIGISENIPKSPLHLVDINDSQLKHLPRFYELILNVEWLSQLLSAVIKIACQRSPEYTSWRNRDRFEWQKEIGSKNFFRVMDRLSSLFRFASFELCNIRTSEDFETRELERWKSPGESTCYPAKYILRIVCSDGAIVRDGIDIDSCASVGGLEMGEEVVAYERCINRSGIMRYRTDMGWISEQTRGHGREPIAEVIEISGIGKSPSKKVQEFIKTKKSSNCGVPDLCSVTASVLARLQSSQCNLYSSISRVIMVGLRHFDNNRNSDTERLQKLVCHVGDFLRDNFRVVLDDNDDCFSILNCPSGACMFLGNMLSVFHSCLYEEKREKQVLNIMLLANILYNDFMPDCFLLSPQVESSKMKPYTPFNLFCFDLEKRETVKKDDKEDRAAAFAKIDDQLLNHYSQKADEKNKLMFEENQCNMIKRNTGFYEAIRVLMEFSLDEIAEMQEVRSAKLCPSQRVPRSIAASLPSALSLLRRLSSQTLSIESSMSELIGKMEKHVFLKFMRSNTNTIQCDSDLVFSFRQSPFALAVHSHIGALTIGIWKHPQLRHCPAHLINPILGLVKDTMHCLKESMDRKDIRNRTSLDNVIPFSLGQERSVPSISRGGDRPVDKINEDDDVSDSSNDIPQSDTKSVVEARYDKASIELITKQFDYLKDSLFQRGLDLLGSEDQVIETHTKIGKLKESESFGIAIASFLLETYSRYNFDRKLLVSIFLDRLVTLTDIMSRSKNSDSKISDGVIKSFASLCHVAVIFLRALPGTRVLVLERNLVKAIIQCIRSVSKKHTSTELPLWLSPALLFVEVMAKPITLSSDVFDACTRSKNQKDKHANELEKVCHEHKKQKKMLQKTSKRIKSALSHKGADVCGEEDVNSSIGAFSEVPPFAPLITSETADHCLTICLQLLRQNKRFKVGTQKEEALTAESTHAVLLLLTRVLSFPKVAARCVRMGGVEVLLSLSSKSRFKGHTSLLTLAFRLMLEDETTIVTLFESEIKKTLTKLSKTKIGGKCDAPVKPFLKAMTKHICRDPQLFMRAAAVTITISQTPSSIGDTTEARVSLLPPESRIKHAKALNECFRPSDPRQYESKTPSKTITSSKTPMKQLKGNKSIERVTSYKTPDHRNERKTPYKEKIEKDIHLSGSLSNYIVSSICNELIKSYERHLKSSQAENIPFLCVFEYFEILSDLVLLIPSCSPALYNYRIATLGKKNNNRSVIAYFLHTMLPQPRENTKLLPKRDQEELGYDSSTRKSHYYLGLRIAQACARTLVVIVARPGEGRRKVISELSHAFGETRMSRNDDNFMRSLQSWGELCLGLVAPRRSNTGHDNDSSLSLDVIKVMMECDMACAMMNAVQRIKLEHSLAAVVAANLLKPLEIFTRRTVIDSIQGLADKEKSRSDLHHLVPTEDEKKNHESSENALLDAGFDPDHISEGGEDDADLHLDDDDDDDDESRTTGIDDDSETSDDVIMMEASEEEGGVEDDYMSSSEMESESESDESEEDSVDDSNDLMESYDEEDLEDLIEVDHNEYSSDDDSIVDENDEANDDEDHEHNAAAFGYDIDEDDENAFFEDDEDIRDEEVADAEEEEDWTNIDRGAGFGFESLFSASRHALPIGRPRAPTGMIEAAASVLGNILQSGEIPIQALEQLQQIGVPVSREVHRMHFVPRHTREGGMMNRAHIDSNEVDSIPVIHQLPPPDNGFAQIDNTGRASDINFMEYLYGGLVIGASRVYYDLISTSDDTDDTNQHLLSIPSVMETELFPGGPAANTTTRMSETTHILLSGLCLPPLNALISTTCRNEDSGLHRARIISSDPFGGWQEIFSGSGGNIIRLGRFADRSGQSSNNGNGISMEHEAIESEGASAFSLAFERTLNAFTSQSRNQTQENVNDTGIPSHDDISDFINRVVAAGSRGDASAQDSTQHDANINMENSESNADGRGNQPEVQHQDPAIQESHVSVNPSNDQRSRSGQDDATQSMNVSTMENAEAPEGLNATSTSEVEHDNNVSNLPVATNDNVATAGDITTESNLRCPPGMDPEVFAQLPFEMQHEIVQEHEATSALASQLGESSSLDPEALAALPEEVRIEVLAQERQNRAIQEVSEPADPARAEEMDPASFIASLAPDLRQEILMTADDDFLSSLPPDIRTEAEVIRERALLSRGAIASVSQSRERSRQNRQDVSTRRSSRKKHKSQVRVDCNRSLVIYVPQNSEAATGQLVTPESLKSLIDLMFLLSPVRPQRLLQKLFLNLCYHPDIRKILAIVFIALLNDEPGYAIEAIKGLGGSTGLDMSFSKFLIGPPPEFFASESDVTNYFSNNQVTSAASAIALNLPISSRGSVNHSVGLPPVVSRRLLGTLLSLTKSGTRMPVDILSNFDCDNENRDSKNTCLDTILSLMAKPAYSQSTSSLEELLGVIDNICFPLEYVFNDRDNVVDPSDKDLDVAAASGKEYVVVPRTTVASKMLKLLCSILLLDSCKDALFAKVSSIVRRLSRVEENRKCILDELALVAQELGIASIRDLRSLKIQLELAAQNHRVQLSTHFSDPAELDDDKTNMKLGTASSAVTLSTTSTDLKLLRVLQTLFSLCNSSQENNEAKKDDTRYVSQELLSILQKIELDNVWEQLTSCLNVVSFLEGVDTLTKEADDEKKDSDDDADEDDLSGGKKLQNTVAGLLTRFLPSIEAFFIVNACVIEVENASDQVNTEEKLAGGDKVLKFVSANKVLLNALLRSIPSLLDKGLRALVQIPKCCAYLDFDVKRHWFKQQVRKLRAQASRRHGSLRLNIRRPYVFEDAYRQLNLRTSDEMRGRLHVTFVNEEGVDAGGLSREFFGILAKEIFNPNYALFTSTEDGCTFQPNPLSSINREHLDYLRFVGRIVGKAVADGFLLDAHFTRSLYKHMLGMKPTYHDMQAIDPDFYKNLKMILDYNLEDIGLDLTFSTVTYWFGRAQTVDLIPNGRNIPVTETDKEKYVDLVCQHRMTTSIEKQVDAFLDGFYDLVKPELISVFNPRELELIISGMPDIDILDLKKNTDYHGWRPADKEIIWFWNILFSLSKSDKAAFLQFVTGSSKVPLNGFSELQGMRGIQKFSIHKASGSEGALMSAHTCFNSLDLPTYKSEEEMREKLMYAIKEGASGFLFA
jgi:E3 ubiquitin-protein ligase HUWE1